jgi:hypothetical protein
MQTGCAAFPGQILPRLVVFANGNRTMRSASVNPSSPDAVYLRLGRTDQALAPAFATRLSLLAFDPPLRPPTPQPQRWPAFGGQPVSFSRPSSGACKVCLTHFRRGGVDVCGVGGVQTASGHRKDWAPMRNQSNYFCAPRPDNNVQFRSIWLGLPGKLGTTSPCLLQCSRDQSQPSSAVELENLAAHARPG